MKKKEKIDTITIPEWIWIDGYKGTDSEMRCRDYQYILGEIHEMPEDAEIRECHNGFHLCKELKNVFRYYSLGRGNRFFKVRALVRVSDFIGTCEKTGEPFSGRGRDDKFVAKSIQFISEVSMDEIFAEHPCADEMKTWTTEEKQLAIECGINDVKRERRINELISLGYARPVAEYLMNMRLDEVAVIFGSQTDISIETRMAFILEHLKYKMIHESRDTRRYRDRDFIF